MSLWTVPRTNEGWRWDLLARDESPLGVLDGVKSGRLEYSVAATVRSTGSFTWSGTDPLDWRLLRVQPWYTADTALGRIEIPLGVFLMSSPSNTYDDALVTTQVDLYDKMLILDQRKVLTSYSVAAGVVVAAALRALLVDYSVAIDDSAETLAAPMSWPAGTSYLRIANDLLASINYFSLYADGYGVFRCERYAAPAYRSIEWEFEDSGESVYKPGFSEEQDLFDAPNVVLLIARQDGDVPALTSVARNDDPESITSTVSRGREVPYVEENVEATTQAVLDAMAQRKLLDLRSIPLNTSIAHPQLPFGLNDAVTFVNERRGIRRLMVVQSMTMTSGIGASVSTRLLEVGR